MRKFNQPGGQADALLGREGQLPAPLVDFDRLAFVEFSFENFEAERIENLLLDRALQRTRAVDRIVAFAAQ